MPFTPPKTSACGGRRWGCAMTPDAVVAEINKLTRGDARAAIWRMAAVIALARSRVAAAGEASGPDLARCLTDDLNFGERGPNV